MSLFNEAQLVRAKLNPRESYKQLSLAFDSYKCCHCKGYLKKFVSCGYQTRDYQYDQEPQKVLYACSHKCRDEYFAKVKEEEDKIPSQEMPEEMKLDYKIKKRYTHPRLGNMELYLDEELPKGIKLRDNPYERKEQIKELTVEDFNPQRNIEEID